MNKSQKIAYVGMTLGVVVLAIFALMVSCGEANAQSVAGSITGGTTWFITIVRACGAAIVIMVVLRMFKGHFNPLEALGAIVGFIVATNPNEVLSWIGA